MNIITDAEKLIGSVAICNIGRIGLIKKVRCTNDGYLWEGVGLFDKKRWRSKCPVPIAWSMEDYTKHEKTWKDFRSTIKRKLERKAI